MYRSVFRPGLFDGKRVVVTGGGSGIGRCTAHELAALGAALALIGRNEDKLRAVQEELTRYGAAVSVHPCDVRDEARVRETLQSIAASGPIDALVNNAGGQFLSPVQDISLNGWEAVVRTNLTGGFLVARECFRASMREHGGAIVNIIADMWRSMPMMSHSGAARAGMLSFTETAAVEWASYGIRVNAVAPGYIASSGFTKYPEEARPIFQRMPEWVPLQRCGTEAEVSAAIVFLLSEAAAFITGSCLRVDGGAPNARVGWPLAAHDKSVPYRGFDGETHVDWLTRDK